MSQSPPSRHIPRAPGTARLDGFVSSTGGLQPPGSGPLESVIHRQVLSQELAQAEKVLSAMRLRVKALERALALGTAAPDAVESLFAGVSEYERAFTAEAAQALAANPDLERRARILVAQFQGALGGLAEARSVHQQFVTGGLEAGKVEGFSLSKLKGSLYPLYNFSTVFAGHPLLGTMFPPLQRPVTQRLPTASATVPQAPAPAADPSPEAAKERGFGWLKKAQDAANALRRPRS